MHVPITLLDGDSVVERPAAGAGAGVMGGMGSPPRSGMSLQPPPLCLDLGGRGGGGVGVDSTTSQAGAAGAAGAVGAGGGGAGQQPVRVVTALGAISRSKPTHIAYRTSTLLYLVTSGPRRGRKRSGRRQQQQQHSAWSGDGKGKSSSAAAADAGAGGGMPKSSSQMSISDQDGPDPGGPGGNSASGWDSGGDGGSYAGFTSEYELSPGALWGGGTGNGNGNGNSSDPFSSAAEAEAEADYDTDPEDTAMRTEEAPAGGAEGSGGRRSAAKGFDTTASMSFDRSAQSPESAGGLPHAFVALCSRTSIYLLAPYSSITIASCSDCEIVLGAVAGALIITGCERVKVTATCRKLITHSCLDCEISVATLSPTVVSGDSRGVLFGPLNVTYRHLRYVCDVVYSAVSCHEHVVCSTYQPPLSPYSTECTWNSLGCTPSYPKGQPAQPAVARTVGGRDWD